MYLSKKEPVFLDWSCKKAVQIGTDRYFYSLTTGKGNNYPPAEPEALRLLAPRRGLPQRNEAAEWPWDDAGPVLYGWKFQFSEVIISAIEMQHFDFHKYLI